MPLKSQMVLKKVTYLISNFSSLVEMVYDDESLIPSVGEEIVDHLEILSRSFHGYFDGR